MNINIKHILIALCVCGVCGWAGASDAAPKARHKRNRARSTSKARRVVKKKAFVHRTYYSSSVGLLTWQEVIRAHRASDSTGIQTQLLGVQGDFSYNFEHTSRWIQHDSLKFAAGLLKGKGASDEIDDELKNQKWVMLTASPGLIYRTTPVSDVGVGLPLSYRYIAWKLNPALNLNVEKSSSFSIGVSGTYVNRLSRHSSLYVVVEHQHMWDAVLWFAGWNYIY
jgi:hypothetical protein